MPSTVPNPNNLKPSAVTQLKNTKKSDAVNSSITDRGLTLYSALEDLLVAGLLKSLDKFGNIASEPKQLSQRLMYQRERKQLIHPFTMQLQE
jgi:hypothetical protein